ncbi:MAG: HPr kinase/phosphorylase [Rhodothermales bacterium]|nr:HPr kinase/phosphorylase [Rhodothermales bacterium]MBO6778450.1 HPr kinase/phosphorylase [Rhodothermales bacterium]
MPHNKPFKKDSITVAFLIEQLTGTVGMDVTSVNGLDGKGRLITESNLHRPGLALAGYLELFTHQRIQILGNTENRYLAHLKPAARKQAFENLLGFDIPCLFLTESNRLDDALVKMATKAGVPVYMTPLPSTDFMAVLRDFLSDQFALQQSMHGALVDVYGIGLLITGAAGIGKSEVALDLVERGHRLVADDVVMVTRKEEQVLIGAGTDLVQHFMEIRGLGLIDVRAMFGVRAIRFQKRVEVVVNLHPWDPDTEYTRLGMVEETYNLMGVELPLVKLPITPGKNVTVLCEVIAMNHLLRHYGYDAAEVFAARLAQRIKEKSAGAEPNRGIEYFEHDYE